MRARSRRPDDGRDGAVLGGGNDLEYLLSQNLKVVLGDGDGISDSLDVQKTAWCNAHRTGDLA